MLHTPDATLLDVHSHATEVQSRVTADALQLPPQINSVFQSTWSTRSDLPRCAADAGLLLCNRSRLNLWDLSLADTASCDAASSPRMLRLTTLGDPEAAADQDYNAVVRLASLPLPAQPPADALDAHGNDLRCYVWSDATRAPDVQANGALCSVHKAPILF